MWQFFLSCILARESYLQSQSNIWSRRQLFCKYPWLFYSNSVVLSLLIVNIFGERKKDFIFIDYSRNWYYLRSKEIYFQVDGYKIMYLANSLEEITNISSKYLRNVQPWKWQKPEVSQNNVILLDRFLHCICISARWCLLQDIPIYNT